MFAVLLMLSALPGNGPADRARESLERRFPELYRDAKIYFSRRGCSPEDSKDLAQETFLHAFRSIGSFRGDSELRTWVLAIAKNLWLNHLRDAAAAKRQGREVSWTEDGSRPARARQEENLLDRERRRALKEAIDRLPPRMRRCVQLRVYQDRSYREIAEILEITEETAKSQVSRARERLGRELVEHYPGLAKAPGGPRTKR